LSFDHHHKQHAASVPSADPGYPPAIDPVAQRDRLCEPEELGPDFHASCMALHRRTVKAQALMEFATDIWTYRPVVALIGKRLERSIREAVTNEHLHFFGFTDKAI
jgi:hypothetical protein